MEWIEQYYYLSVVFHHLEAGGEERVNDGLVRDSNRLKYELWVFHAGRGIRFFLPRKQEDF